MREPHAARNKAPVWQNIPDFLSYKIETMRIIFPLMNYEALKALNLTTLSNRRAHLCQVYIDRLRNKNHPLHFMLPNRRRLCIIIMLDLALAAPRVTPVGPSARKSLSRISIPSGLYNYFF